MSLQKIIREAYRAVSHRWTKIIQRRTTQITPVDKNSSCCQRITRPTSRIPQQSAPEPPPIEIEGEFEYEVEQILDSRLYRGNLQYLVKWLGYTEEHNTWEPLSNITNADEAVKEFHKHHPSAPHRIQTLSLIRFQPIINHTDIPKGVTSKLNLEEQTFRETRILKRE